jgi:hypothetical protein
VKVEDDIGVSNGADVDDAVHLIAVGIREEVPEALVQGKADDVAVERVDGVTHDRGDAAGGGTLAGAPFEARAVDAAKRDGRASGSAQGGA